MGMFNNFAISGSAMNAQSIRLNLVASNLANANSISSSVDQTYRARHAIFQTALQDNMQTDAGGMAAGVKVAGIVESDAPLRAEYRPNHPMADKDGYVYLPNVNTIEEMTDMLDASQSYKTNVQVLDTTKQLLLRTIRLGQSGA